MNVCACLKEEVLTGSHKQVATSLPRGLVVMMRRGGATGVWRGKKAGVTAAASFLSAFEQESRGKDRSEGAAVIAVIHYG